MFLLGGSVGVFVMSWHITTFIIHSHRIPFMGATRQAFLKYCINNSLLPLVFLLFYTVVQIRFQSRLEGTPAGKIIRMQAGFYLGFLVIIMISFAYFFRVGRDLLKVVLARITNPSRIRDIIPYDTLDYEYDLIRAQTYLSETMKVEKISALETYPPRLLTTVLRRHHRNAVTATIFSFITLLLLGIFMETPLLRIPAGAGFMLLFAITMGIVGAAKYFLKSWELIGWLIIASVLSLLVHYKFFDLRSIAYGVNYHSAARDVPQYQYDYLKQVFSTAAYERDKNAGMAMLQNWKNGRGADSGKKPPLVVVCISGGGSRAAYWTFRSLQYADSITHGALFKNTVLLTGASGGMFGAAYWRTVHQQAAEGRIKNVYSPRFQENIGKDLLNAVIFSLVSVDLISPFNKTTSGGYTYTRDRGYALEQELISNTDGMLDQRLKDYKQAEAQGQLPLLIINGTIVNDGRKLMMSAQPITYLTRAAYTLRDTNSPAIDAIDFGTFFAKQDAYNMRLTTALRINATFPVILPVVKMPSEPQMNVMDAGLRDNFGMELVTRYLYVFRQWMAQNVGDVIVLQIRDTRENEVLPETDQNTLGKMISDPLFVIQNKWQPFQSYYHGYLKDYVPHFMQNNLHFISLQYVPQEKDRAAALNFHITQKEKMDLAKSIYHPSNTAALDSLKHLLQ
jgi:hypothetical protein